jgi:hypothetical protein
MSRIGGNCDLIRQLTVLRARLSGRIKAISFSSLIEKQGQLIPVFYTRA